MARTSSIHVFDHFDLYLTPVILTFNLLKKNVPNGTSPPQGQQLCQIILKSMHYCTSFDLDKSRRTRARMHAHTPNKNCNNYISLTRKRARQKWRLNYLGSYWHSMLLTRSLYKISCPLLKSPTSYKNKLSQLQLVGFYFYKITCSNRQDCTSATMNLQHHS